MKRNFNFFVEKTIPEETSAARSTLYILKSGNPFQQKREMKTDSSATRIKSAVHRDGSGPKKVVSFERPSLLKRNARRFSDKIYKYKMKNGINIK
jgi:hypothetical protein